MQSAVAWLLHNCCEGPRGYLPFYNPFTTTRQLKAPRAGRGFSEVEAHLRVSPNLPRLPPPRHPSLHQLRLTRGKA